MFEQNRQFFEEINELCKFCKQQIYRIAEENTFSQSIVASVFMGTMRTIIGNEQENE